MTPHYLIQAIFAIAGIVSVLAAIWNWEWFFTARNTQIVVRNVGRTRARWFYATVGLLCIGMAIFFFIQTKSALSAL